MTPQPDSHDEPALARAAHSVRVVVAGAGIAGLVAARECAKLGMAVTIVEASDEIGGCVASVDLAGVRVDAGADSLGRGGAVDQLIDELGLSGDVREAADGTAWVVGDRLAAPLPTDTLAGIPANPWAEDVRRVIGWRGAWRAYLDRLRPVLTIGRVRNLGDLVRSRMGDRVARRLVAPRSLAVWGLAPEGVDVDAAAPGLNSALTRLGSLAGAVGSLLEEHPPTPERTLRGGLHTLVDALADDLDRYAVTVHRGDAVTGVQQRSDDTWRIVTAEGEHDADVLIVATDERTALRLLPAPGSDLAAAEHPDTDHVAVTTLVVTTDATLRPVAYPITGSRTWAQSASAHWGDAVPALPDGAALIRVIAPPDEDRDPVALAGTLLGGSFTAADAIASETITMPLSLPGSALARGEAPDRVRRDAWHAMPGLSVVGQWVSGSGLGAVIADARAEADRVRSAALWEGPAPR